MLIMTSQASHNEAGDPATFAPRAASGCVLAVLRFQTVISWPHDLSRCAIAAPILPVPHIPTLMTLSFCLLSASTNPGATSPSVLYALCCSLITSLAESSEEADSWQRRCRRAGWC